MSPEQKEQHGPHFIQLELIVRHLRKITIDLHIVWVVESAAKMCGCERKSVTFEKSLDGLQSKERDVVSEVFHVPAQ
jgi:hypothetical protein